MADIQIQGSGTAAGALGMMDKQVKRIGNRSHGSFVKRHALPSNMLPTKDMEGQGDIDYCPNLGEAPAPSAEAEQLQRCINVFCTTTDGGSDEAAARRLKLIMGKDSPLHLEFDSDCFAHIAQLLYLDSLGLVDWIHRTVLQQPCKFWSGLAQTMHTWRSNSTAIYQAYARLFTASEAHRCGLHRAPPQPLVGRWGNAKDCVSRLLQAQPAKLAKAIIAAKKNQKQKQQKQAPGTPAADNSAGGVGELSVEETREFQERASK